MDTKERNLFIYLSEYWSSDHGHWILNINKYALGDDIMLEWLKAITMSHHWITCSLWVWLSNFFSYNSIVNSSNYDWYHDHIACV